MNSSLLRWTDQCVQCGLCLPHCPTYLLTKNEAESPRGRIALIRALATNQLTADTAFSKHIDQCTGCLRCQSSCPANVNYADIIDMGKSLQRKNSRFTLRSMRTSLITWTLTHQTGSAAAAMLNSLAQKANLPSALPMDHSMFRQPHNAIKTQDHNAKVYLFRGCTGKYFDRTTWLSARSLLNKLGIEAIDPPQHLCCGAIAQHSGNPEYAQYLMENSVVSLQASGYPVLTFATGCSVHFERYLSNSHSNTEFQLMDIHQFLAKQTWPDKLRIMESTTPVFLHMPCSVYQSSAGDNAIKEVLAKIPNIQVTQATQSFGCCGAGGINLITQREIGDKLARSVVEEIQSSKTRLVVTANIGCQLQLRRTMQKHGLDIPVIHPVTLLDHLTDYA